MLKQRIITGSILLATILLAIAYLPPTALHTLFGLILLLAAYELTALLGIRGVYTKVLYCGLLVAGTLFAENLIDGTPYVSEYADYDHWVLILWLFILVFIILLHDGVLRNQRIIKNTFAVVSTLILPIAYLSFSTVGFFEGNWIIITTVVLLVVVSDTSAYFFGKRFGKKKFFPNISPTKTMAGFWASNVCIVLYAMICIIYITADKVPFDFWISNPLVLFHFVQTFILLNLFAITGDIFISALKRHAGVKDSGTLLPGHGGVLDRIDSLIPVVSLYLFIRNIPNIVDVI